MENDVRERLEALEWLVARLIAEAKPPAVLDRELEQSIPAAMYELSPDEHRALPHWERVLRLAILLQREAGLRD